MVSLILRFEHDDHAEKYSGLGVSSPESRKQGTHSECEQSPPNLLLSEFGRLGSGVTRHTHVYHTVDIHVCPEEEGQGEGAGLGYKGHRWSLHSGAHRPVWQPRLRRNRIIYGRANPRAQLGIKSLSAASTAGGGSPPGGSGCGSS